MTKKKLTRSKLVKKLDRVFSWWVRLSNTDNAGYITCYTCGKKVHWKKSHASHYVDRRHMKTRFDPRNVKPSCIYCNTFLEGNKDEYTLHLIKDYGNNILQELNQAKHAPYKIYTTEIETMIEDYKEKLKELDNLNH